MLELQKFVLQQVADNSALFKKELQKSFMWLRSEEIELLRVWVMEQYGNNHQDIINEVFLAVEAHS